MKSTPHLPSPVTAPWSPKRNQSPSLSARWSRSQSQSGRRIQAASGLGLRQRTASCRGWSPPSPARSSPSTSQHPGPPGLASHQLSPSGKLLPLACRTPTPGAGLGGKRTAGAGTSPLPLGRPCDSEPGFSQGTQFPHLKMGKVGLVTHNLGLSPWLADVEVGIPAEILKVHEVVNSLFFSVQPAAPQGAAALSLHFYLPKSWGGDPSIPGSGLSWGLALDSISSSRSHLPSMPVFASPGPSWSGAFHA